VHRLNCLKNRKSVENINEPKKIPVVRKGL
jgi:hypothetical protein